MLACGIIVVVSYEPGTRGVPTPRKCRRIRRLTKFKLYVYKYVTSHIKYYNGGYLDKVYKKFHFLIDKKQNGV